MDDNSSGEGQVESGTPEIQLTERQLQQQQGWTQLAQGHRDVIQTALKEPTEANLEALRKLEKAEPKFASSILKDYGYENLDGYANAIKKSTSSTEEFLKILDEREQTKAISAAKAQIDSQFAQLPEGIRELAQTEFNDLIEGKKLTPEKMTEYAKKSVMLANQSSGNQYKLSALSLGSSGISSNSNSGGNWADEFIAAKAKNDDFYKYAAPKSK